MATNTGNNPNIIRGKSKPDIEAIIAHTRTALLTKLQDGVERLSSPNMTSNLISRASVMALIQIELEKAGE